MLLDGQSDHYHLLVYQNDINAIVVIHLFAHMRKIHVSNYKIKMQFIRASVERLLGRHSNVKVFIKMPHTFTETYNALNDFFECIYNKIIFEVFKCLYEKFIALNQRDATMNACIQIPEYLNICFISCLAIYVNKCIRKGLKDQQFTISSIKICVS